MVGVAVEVGSGGEGAAGIALSVAFGVFEEILVEDVGAVEVPSVIGAVGEGAGDDDLVEEVPLALVGECADACVELAPEWVIEPVGSYAVGIALCTENLCA